MFLSNRPFRKPRQNALADFAITFQSALENCEIDYPAGRTRTLEQCRGGLNSLLSSTDWFKETLAFPFIPKRKRVQITLKLQFRGISPSPFCLIFPITQLGPTLSKEVPDILGLAWNLKKNQQHGREGDSQLQEPKQSQRFQEAQGQNGTSNWGQINSHQMVELRCHTSLSSAR